MTTKITCQNIWKVFGPNPSHVLNTLDYTLGRNEILAQTGHVVAVREVSFSVAEGETFVVMGLSGSGKSTLIRCLSRLIEPTRGTITVNGREVTTMSEDELRRLRRHTMSMVFQRFGLFPHRRVLDNVCYGLEVRGQDKNSRESRANEILELVGLAGWEYHYPHELSGGMQQRVGLARALAVDPEILLCDEPFSALDPLIRREMQDELIRLQKTLHKTIVFISHDFLEALKLGDRIAIMKDGRIVQIGTPQQIVAHPANDYVREFVKDVPRAKVLTARTIMTAATQSSTSAANNHVNPERVHAETTLEQLIPLTAGHSNPLPVTDNDGTIIGLVDRTAVLMALAEQPALNR
jgi:glycine betaine/proline transport system ATP-binding protein